MRYFMAVILAYAAIVAWLLWPFGPGPDTPSIRRAAPLLGLAWIAGTVLVLWAPLQFWSSRGVVRAKRLCDAEGHPSLDDYGHCRRCSRKP